MGHHLQIKWSPPFLCDHKWYNIKAFLDHLYGLWEEFDEVLAKGAIELSTDGAGSYSDGFLWCLGI